MPVDGKVRCHNRENYFCGKLTAGSSLVRPLSDYGKKKLLTAKDAKEKLIGTFDLIAISKARRISAGFSSS